MNVPGKTYTLAIANDMLVACVPDGGNMAAAISARERLVKAKIGEYATVDGCLLTNELPADPDAILWRSGGYGWLRDEAGREWLFAIRNGSY